MEVVESGLPEKERRSVQLVGPSIARGIRSFGRDIVTLERAVKERVFFVKTPTGFAPPPQPIVNVRRSLSGFVDRLKQHLPSTVPLDPQSFVDTFQGRKKELYQEVLNTRWGTRDSYVDARIKPFVKFEKMDTGLKSDPVPRVVSPRSPVYNIAVGRFLRPIEKDIFKAIDSVFGGPTVMKGYDAYRQASIIHSAWGEFRDPVAFGLDASRFDQHVSRDMLAWEHSVYNLCFALGVHRRELASLLKHQLDNRCKSKCNSGSISYTTKGVRMSGDMNTSLGACLIMCALVWSYRPGCHFRLINNGDDCVIITERADYSRFQNINSYFLLHGFTLVREPMVDIIEEIQFCQTQPIFTPSGWFMCRNPRSLFSKDHVSLQYRHGKNLRKWMKSVGGVKEVFSGVPVHSSVYAAFDRCGEGVVNTKDLTWSQRKLYYGAKSTGSITYQTRYSYFLAFGIPPDAQEDMEAMYKTIDLGKPSDFHVLT